MPRITVDEVSYDVASGTLLDALRSVGRAVPALCHDARLAPIGMCRLCLVDVAGRPSPVAACATAVEDGMQVRARTPELEAVRRTLLELLAAQYPAEAVAASPDVPFHRLLTEYGVTAGAPLPSSRPVDDAHPYIRVDLNRCIACMRCVRICADVQGQFVWRVWERGDRIHVRPGSNDHLIDSACVSCGACVDTCPTGALEDKPPVPAGARWTTTTCPYCGTGCEMSVGVAGGRIVGVRPVPSGPVSRGHLCVKGRYAYEFNGADDRITTPMIREGDRWREVSWTEALAFAARRLQTIIDCDGPEAVGILGSARATNEDNYVIQKFARLVIGTNSVDNCARVCHAPSAEGLKLVLGAGAATSAFDDIEAARTLLVYGANATENHPVIGARIKQAVLHGAQLIVVDPRRTELAEHATIHLAPRPGTNVPLLNALAHAIVHDTLYDGAFVRERLDGWEDYVRFVAQWPPERASAICGVPPDTIWAAARLYASERPSMSVHGLGLTEQVQGTDSVTALINLALITGNVGKPGTGVNPLRGQNNVQGAGHMGCDPSTLTGGVSLREHTARFAEAWGAPLPKQSGLNAMQMIDAARTGRLRALYVVGYDVLLTYPNSTATRAALETLDLVIVQDLFLNETAKHVGTVFFPAASPFERDGTYMNAERRIQPVRVCLAPPGAALPDWRIVCALAAAMGHGAAAQYENAEEIWDEIRDVWPAARGITYARLHDGGLQWPCPDVDHPGTRLLHVNGFACGPRARLQSPEYWPSEEQPSAAFPLTLVTGRTLYHFNAGTMTGRSRTSSLSAPGRLDVAAEDAARLGLATADRVRLRSRHGAIVLPMRVSDRVSPGLVFATFHDPAIALNEVVGEGRDRVVDTPEYKVTAVQLSPVDGL